jgi:hypothetical protein
MTTYWNDWAEGGEAAMLRDFSVDSKVLEGATVLAAAYTYGHYSGSAYVLFEKDGKLFSVNGDHCSCNGLEDQWTPEEVVPAVDKDFSYHGFSREFEQQVKQILTERSLISAP